VRSTNLGEEIWQLQIDRDSGPTLVVNSRVPDLIETLKRDAILQGVIYPEVVRRMVHVVFDEGGDHEEDDWVSDWRTWVEAQLGRDIAEGEADDPDELEALANEVTSTFAAKNRFATNLVAARQHAG
jgi:hypothetical protein